LFWFFSLIQKKEQPENHVSFNPFVSILGDNQLEPLVTTKSSIVKKKGDIPHRSKITGGIKTEEPTPRQLKIIWANDQLANRRNKRRSCTK
jgi:hypothetical protein